ncbi:MAG: hypothetical protein CMI32_04115 [Opitutales bacterium]|nr:hypothetical protein [Opitutales bacterium]
MNITLRGTLPKPMAEAPPEDSGVWQSDVTFDQGERCLIIGKSGCGKTTFMHMLCGMRRDYQGEVLIDGRKATTFSTTDWATLRAERLGLVFQDLRLFGDLTARENLALLPMNEQECPSTEEMAERIGMSPHLDHPCNQLSHGQRQRIAVMRVLLRPFDYLLLDEPFSHLDDTNVKAMTNLIEEEINRREAGLILASLEENSPFEDLRLLRF